MQGNVVSVCVKMFYLTCNGFCFVHVQHCSLTD